LGGQRLSHLRPGKILSHGPLLMGLSAVHREEMERINLGFPKGGVVCPGKASPPRLLIRAQGRPILGLPEGYGYGGKFFAISEKHFGCREKLLRSGC
jgi:hypothetical protein